MSNLTLSLTAVSSSEILGALLRRKRKAQGLTLELVSQHSGLSMRFISEVERGKATAEIGKVLQLLATIGIDLYADSRES